MSLRAVDVLIKLRWEFPETIPFEYLKASLIEQTSAVIEEANFEVPIEVDGQAQIVRQTATIEFEDPETGERL